MQNSEPIRLDGKYTLRKDGGEPGPNGENLVEILKVGANLGTGDSVVGITASEVKSWKSDGRWLSGSGHPLDLIPARVLGEEYIGKHPRELPVGAVFRSGLTGQTYTRTEGQYEGASPCGMRVTEFAGSCEVEEVLSLPDPEPEYEYIPVMNITPYFYGSPEPLYTRKEVTK